MERGEERISLGIASEWNNHLPTSTMPNDIKSFFPFLSIAQQSETLEFISQFLLLLPFFFLQCAIFMFNIFLLSRIHRWGHQSISSLKEIFPRVRAGLDIIYDFLGLWIRVVSEMPFKIGLDPGY
jgi:hypothetical protein